ncbi:peptidoglycan-binding protein LysM [Brachybacterium sp. P6-10-X1]|uniref:peptidoglycan-binding protein LysM n=1 Tax=Brachybacterium sp. P6-10-X1 TaxID=1903186 RepID=UPI000971A70C|nr:peptidoglycan-binding protein LysM [Brachybacterium sp. P6-10-X1]APX34461.1 peptidoglycan-binding protein LysM [Brachybacterium sp. P6-10-X1]
MATQTATVLPFPQHHDQHDVQESRADVRLEPTRRGRALLTLIAFLLGLLVAGALLLVFDVSTALAGPEPEPPTTITVEAGDTLWGYAEQYAPAQMSEREYIAEVRTLNQLPTGRVTAGQQIELPAAGSLTP